MLVWAAIQTPIQQLFGSHGASDLALSIVAMLLLYFIACLFAPLAVYQSVPPSPSFITFRRIFFSALFVAVVAFYGYQYFGHGTSG